MPETPTRREFFKAEPWDKRVDDLSTQTVSLIHLFNEVFSLRQSAQLLQSTLSYRWALGGIRSSFDPATGDILLNRTSRFGDFETIAYRYQGDFLAQYSGLGGKHQTLLGLEFDDADTDAVVLDGTLAPINYTNPVYNSFPVNLAPNPNLTTIVNSNSTGIIAQHQSSFLKNKLNFILGLRWDDRKSITDYRADSRANLVVPYGDPTISPRYGVTVAVIPEVSIYAVYSVDDQPMTVGPKYGALPPNDPRLLETISGARTGKLNELGLKGELFRGRISATVSAFKMTRKNERQNIVRTLPNGAAYNEFFLTSGELVKGIEAQIFGQISSKADFMISYAKMDQATTVLARGPTNIQGIPDDEFNAFVSYSFRDNLKNGFTVRAGYVRIGRMWGHIENLWRFDPQHRADVGISYHRGLYRFDLQVNNVFDDDFIPAAVASDNLAETPPRQILFSVTRKLF